MMRAKESSKLLKNNQEKQYHIIANFEGRSFTVKTERGKCTNSERFNEGDFFLRSEFGIYERKVTVYAKTNPDVQPLSDIFCRNFGTALVTTTLEANKPYKT